MKSISKDHAEAAAGMLLIAGALMHEWGIPLTKAVKGLKLAYHMEKEKQRAKPASKTP